MEEVREQIDYTDEERQFIVDAYEDLAEMKKLRDEPLDMIGGRSMKEFWDQSALSFAVVSGEAEDPNDPVHAYQSSIARDKANVFIANLTGQLMRTSIIAQNSEQAIDRVFGKVCSTLCYWAFRQDGWPNETGEQKAGRVIHACVVKGTAFSFDKVTKDGLDSEYVPVEEMFFPTFWQPNIQKMGKMFRVKLNMTHAEAGELFGQHEKFKYVRTEGWIDEWEADSAGFKETIDGIIEEDKVSVLYVFKLITGDELENLKKQGKVRKNAKRAILYNVIINDVLLFDIWNLSPYRHGFYPFSIARFELMAEPDFLYGNSMPNKCAEDKKWLDEWKTLIRFKGKQKALHPQLVVGGELGEEIYLPSAITSIPEGVESKPVEGIEGVTASDIQLLQQATGEIDRATVSPQSAGQQSDRRDTARATVIQAQASNTLLDSFSQQIFFFMASRAIPLVMALFQHLPKNTIQKIVVPDETLDDGLTGSFEIIFEKNVTELDKITRFERSLKIKQEKEKSRRNNKPKDIVYLDPSYAEELKLYIYSDAESGSRNNDAVKAMQFEQDMPLLIGNPQMFVPQEVAREIVKRRGYSERIIQKENQGQPMQVPPQSQERTPEDRMANAVSRQTTGASMPSLPV